MTLIRTISGIRGIIGGLPGEGLTPKDVVKYVTAYGSWIKNNEKKENYKIIVGRDARISGEMVMKLVSGTLLGTGINVVDIGLATTPTVEIAVTEERADGGIIITASHNPAQWNALKLLDKHGELISAQEDQSILHIAGEEDYSYPGVDQLGREQHAEYYMGLHIRKILALDLVDTTAIHKANFKIVVDCVNSVGGIVVPELLNQLGVKRIVKLYCEATGKFPHNPEPLPQNLEEISSLVMKEKAHLGFAVDPDVDRLAIINEDGSMFGEEYTLVAVADYVLSHQPGNTVSNLSSTRALKDITEKHGKSYFASAVGEVNVVHAMKQHNAVIGGEGNGGVIYPGLHYGRDALVGIALFLSHLAKKGTSCSQLRSEYPEYYISKNKIEVAPDTDIDKILDNVKSYYSNYPVNGTDGVKVELPDGWVHLRKSNTEPIIRIYAEAKTEKKAEELADQLIGRIKTHFY